MRLSLWLRLFLAFAALSGLTLLGFAGWQQHSFRRGFLGYLDAVGIQRLQPAAARLASAYRDYGSWQFLHLDPARLGEFVEPPPRRRWDRVRAPDSVDWPPPPPPPPADRPPRDRRGGDPVEGPPPGPPPGPAPGPPPTGPPPPGPPPRGPPPRRGPPEVMRRLQLVDAAGVYVAGNPHVGADATSVPVMLDGRHIGSLRLAPVPQLSSAADVAFAQSQRHSAVIAALATLVAAFVLAFAMARWLLAPVRALTSGTRALAAGDYSHRIATMRRDELGALSRDFNRLAATLDQHRQARRQWGVDIAHELRTPLSILRGEIQALQDGVRPQSAAALESLQSECERLNRLIEDLYQLSLADAGALEYRFEPLDMAALVREAVELQRPVCADDGILLDDDVQPTAPVRGDARRLAQLLDNLLANARRYTEAPGRIRVGLSDHGSRLRLVVEDSEPGVPEAELPRLFERLYRVERSRNRAVAGAGLGLAICRAIVDAHDGHITAQPSTYGGLRIVVDLPIAERAR